MFSTLRSWLSKSPKSPKRQRRTTLGLTPLEERWMPAVTRPELVAAFNTGVGIVRQAAAVADAVTVVADLPLVAENIPGIAKLTDKLRAAFPAGAVSDAGESADPGFVQIKQAIEEAIPGTKVEQFSVTADANNDLIRIRYEKVIAVPTAFTVGGTTGFSYFDDRVNGTLGGQLTGSNTNVRVSVVYGVDESGGLPSFYVSDQSKLVLDSNPTTPAADPFTVTGSVSGKLAIRALANVEASATVAASLGAQVTLSDTEDGAADGRVRVGSLEDSVRGAVTGDADLNNLQFSATIPVLGKIPWSGQFGGSFVNNKFTVDTFELDAPDVMTVLKGAANGVLGNFGASNLPLLGDSKIRDLLDTPLEVLGNAKPLSKLGLAGGIPSFTTGSFSGSTLEDLRQKLKDKGIELLPGYGTTIGDAGQAIKDLIEGKRVDLIRYTTSGEKTWNISETFGPYVFPIAPPALNGELSLTVNANAGAKYFVGVGADTTGLYIDPRTSFSIFGGAGVSADGAVKLFGLAGLEISLGVGARLEAGVTLNDPDPSDGKIYLDEVFSKNPGESDAQAVLRSLLETLRFYAKADATGSVRVNLDLPWPIPDITLLDKEYTITPLWDSSTNKTVQTRRAIQLAPDKPLDAEALVQVQNGQRVLVLDGSAETNGISARLTNLSDGKVKVTWFGKGEGTVENIDRVQFTGSDKVDRLDVDPTLDVPITADGGPGNDQLSGGAGNDTLDGGAGIDDLSGGGGNDVITGGTGRNILRGGVGNDSLAAGGSGDQLSGDDGDDVLTGGTGNDIMDGGAGNDVMSGGFGNDQMFGGLDNDTMTGGDGNDVMDGGDGSDSIAGVAGDDVIHGGAGNDTIDGGAGKDKLYGGADNDVMDGGDGEDVLRGGAGNDTLTGGNGNDLLSGGTGLDNVYGDDIAGQGTQSGQDGFEVNFDDTDGFDDKLSGGPDRDYIVVVGRVDEGNNVELADDIKIVPGSTAGSFIAGWRPAGSTDAYKKVSFAIPADVDAVWVRTGGGNDRVEIDAAVTTPIYVDGGIGNDTIFGGDSQDILYGGAGNDTIDGRGGNDLIYGDGDVNVVGVQVPVATADEGNDVLFGGDGIDVIYGSGGADRIDGGAGADNLFGGNGNDILTAGAGTFGDHMHGEAGFDTLLGGAGADVMSGGSENDTLIGGNGADQMNGDDGNDVLVGELGRDRVSGGFGNDTLKAFIDNNLRAAVSASTGLSLPAVTPPTPDQDATLMAALQAEEDLLEAREAVLLAIPVSQLTPEEIRELQAVQDRLVAIDFDENDLRRYNSLFIDELSGGDGNDTLTGSLFNDRLDGGAHDDTLNQSDLGQFGGDVILGGTGTDAFVISGTAAADTITLTSEADGRVSVFGAGGVLLGQFGDGVTTNAFQEVETLRVNAGDGNDTVSLAGLGQKVPVSGRIEVFGQAGNDVLNASTYEGQTLLDGGAGFDTLTGGLIADTLIGGTENDNIIGGTGNDSISGDDGNDVIDAGAGTDTVYGGSGNDSVTGGAGSDSIDGGSGADTLDGDQSQTTAGAGNDTVVGGTGNDKVVGGFGADSLDGGDGNDILFGDSETVTGGGNDTLIGGTGYDELFGQAGNDLLVGNTSTGTPDGSQDKLDGGTGTDVAKVSFKEKETLIGIESLNVFNPGNAQILIRSDLAVMALESGGTAWVNGVAEAVKALDIQMNSAGTLFIHFVDLKLVKITISGTRTTVAFNVLEFFLDANGNPVITKVPNKPDPEFPEQP